MSNENLKQSADYTIDNAGNLHGNEPLLALRKQVEELRVAEEMMNAAFCGALIFSLFKRHAWLDRLEVDLSSTAEYDDDGGSYRSARLQVSQVDVRDGMSVPDHVLELDSSSPLCVEDAIADSLEDYAGDFYAALRDDGDHSEFSLSFARVHVSDLFNEPTVSAREAFVRLLPEYDYLIRQADGKF